jgi:hypothetical protein
MIENVVTITDTQVTINPSVPLVTGDIDAQTYDIQTTGTMRATTMQADTIVAGQSIKTPLLLGVAVNDSDTVYLGDDDAFMLTRPQHTHATCWRNATCSGADDGTGMPCALHSNGSACAVASPNCTFTAMHYSGNNASRSACERTGYMYTAANCSGIGACANCSVAVHCQGSNCNVNGTTCAHVAANCSGGGDASSEAACTYTGYTYTSGDATSLTIQGQQGAAGFDGGDLVLQAGMGSGAAAHGNLILGGATVHQVVTVTDSQVTINPAALLVTGEINAQSYDINTTGTLKASNIESQTVVASVSVTTPLLLSTDDTIRLGDDDSFLLTRPNHTSGAGTALTIQGQAAANCVPTGNTYTAASCSNGGNATSQALCENTGNVYAGPSCIGGDDGTGTNCTLNAGGSACNVTSLNCTFSNATCTNGGNASSAPACTLTGSSYSPPSCTNSSNMTTGDASSLQACELTCFSGGDVILQAGTGGGSSPVHGNLILAGATVDNVVTISDSQVTISNAVQLITGEINAQGHNITTTGTVSANTVVANGQVSAPSLVATTAVSTPLFTTPLTRTFAGLGTNANGLPISVAADVLEFGDDDPFVLTRPDHSSGAGTPFVIQGQASSGTGDGGDVVIRPGLGATTSTDGNLLMQDARGHTILQYGTGAVAGSQLIRQTLQLGNDDAEVVYTITREPSVGAAGATKIVGQGVALGGNAPGGDLKFEGGESGSISSYGGDVYVDGGPSCSSCGTQGANVLYGTVHLGTSSGSVKVGTTASVTEIAGGLTVAGALTASNIRSDYVAYNTAYINVGTDSGFTFGRLRHSTGAGTAFTINGQDGAANSNGGDLILQPGAKGGAAAKDGVISMVCLSTQATSCTASEPALNASCNAVNLFSYNAAMNGSISNCTDGTTMTTNGSMTACVASSASACAGVTRSDSSAACQYTSPANAMCSPSSVMIAACQYETTSAACTQLASTHGCAWDGSTCGISNASIAACAAQSNNGATACTGVTPTSGTLQLCQYAAAVQQSCRSIDAVDCGQAPIAERCIGSYATQCANANLSSHSASVSQSACLAIQDASGNSVCTYRPLSTVTVESCYATATATCSSADISGDDYYSQQSCEAAGACTYLGQAAGRAACTAAAQCTYTAEDDCATSAFEVSSEKVEVNVPMLTSAIDTGSDGITTTGAMHADQVVVTTGITAPLVTVSNFVQTPRLQSQNNSILIGDSTSDFTLTRPVTTSGSGSALTIQGQQASAGIGGDVVIQPGQGSVSNGRTLIAGATFGSSTGNTFTAATCIGSNNGVGSNCTLNPATNASCAISSGNCAFTADANNDGNATDPACTGDNNGVGAACQINSAGSACAVFNSAYGNCVFTAASCSDNVAASAISQAACETVIAVVEISDTAVTFNKPLTVNAGIDLGNSAVSTEGDFNAMAITAQDHVTSPQIIATASVSTPAIISQTDQLVLGDDDAFEITRPPHTTGAGAAFTISGQDAVSGNIGGDVVLLPGYGTSCFNSVGSPLMSGAATAITALSRSTATNFFYTILTVASTSGFFANDVVVITSVAGQACPISGEFNIQGSPNGVNLPSSGANTLTLTTAPSTTALNSTACLVYRRASSVRTRAECTATPGNVFNIGSVTLADAAATPVMTVTADRVQFAQPIEMAANTGIDAGSSEIKTTGSVIAGTMQASSVTAATVIASTSVTTPRLTSNVMSTVVANGVSSEVNTLTIGSATHAFTMGRPQATGGGKPLNLQGQQGCDNCTGCYASFADQCAAVDLSGTEAQSRIACLTLSSGGSSVCSYTAAVAAVCTAGNFSSTCAAQTSNATLCNATAACVHDGTSCAVNTAAVATLDTTCAGFSASGRAACVGANGGSVCVYSAAIAEACPAVGAATCAAHSAVNTSCTPTHSGALVDCNTSSYVPGDAASCTAQGACTYQSARASCQAETSAQCTYVEGNGGDVVLQPGAAGVSGTASGSVLIKNDQGNNIMTMTTNKVTVGLRLETRDIDAGSSTISTSGALVADRVTVANTLSAPTMTVSNALVTPKLLSSTDTVELGSTLAFTIKRPQQTRPEQCVPTYASACSAVSMSATATCIHMSTGASSTNIQSQALCETRTDSNRVPFVYTPATCGAGNDGAGNPCAVNASGTGCTVSSGTCSFAQSTCSDSNVPAGGSQAACTDTGYRYLPAITVRQNACQAVTMTANASVSVCTFHAGNSTCVPSVDCSGANLAGDESSSRTNCEATFPGQCTYLNRGGTDFVLQGQEGADQYAGGDVVLKPGAAGSISAADGVVQLQDATGTAVVTVSSSAVTVAQTLHTADIDAGSNTVTTQGALNGNTVSATTSLTTPLMTAASVVSPLLTGVNELQDGVQVKTINVGDDAPFTLSRPAQTRAEQCIPTYAATCQQVALTGTASQNQAACRTPVVGATSTPACQYTPNATAFCAAGNAAACGSHTNATVCNATALCAYTNGACAPSAAHAANCSAQSDMGSCIAAQGGNAVCAWTAATHESCAAAVNCSGADLSGNANASAANCTATAGGGGVCTYLHQGGTEFIIAGQPGAANSNGGDVILRPGAAGTDSNTADNVVPTDGNILLTDSAGSPVVTVASSQVTLHRPLVTQTLDAQTYDITTQGAVTAGSITADQFEVTGSIAITSISSASNVLAVGGSEPFTLTRPQHPNASGTDFTLEGQAGADGSNGGDVIIRGGLGGASNCYPQVAANCSADAAQASSAACLGVIDANTGLPGCQWSGTACTVLTATLNTCNAHDQNQSTCVANAVCAFRAAGSAGSVKFAAPGEQCIPSNPTAGTDCLSTVTFGQSSTRSQCLAAGGGNGACVYLDHGAELLSADSNSVTVSVPLSTGSIDAGSSTIATTGLLDAGQISASTSVTAPAVVATTSLSTPLLLGAQGTDVIHVGGQNAFTLKRPDSTSGAGKAFTIAGQAGASYGDSGGNLELRPGARADSTAATCALTAADIAGCTGTTSASACNALSLCTHTGTACAPTASIVTQCAAQAANGPAACPTACTYTPASTDGSVVLADAGGTAVLTVSKDSVDVTQPLNTLSISSTSTLTTTGTVTAASATVAGAVTAQTLTSSGAVVTPSLLASTDGSSNTLAFGGDAAFTISKPQHSDGVCRGPGYPQGESCSPINSSYTGCGAFTAGNATSCTSITGCRYQAPGAVGATCTVPSSVSSICAAYTTQSACNAASGCSFANNACAATLQANCSAVQLYGGSSTQIAADLAACQAVAGCTYNYHVVALPDARVTAIAAMTNPSTGQSLRYGSKHACTLFDMGTGTYQSSGYTVTSAGVCTAPNGLTFTYQQRCAVFQAAIPGYSFRQQGTTTAGVPIDKCFDFSNTGGADTTGYVSPFRACTQAPTYNTWDDTAGAGTELVIKGQAGGGGGCTDAGGSSVGCNGGDVILRPGAASVNGNEGKVLLRNAANLDVVSISGSTVEVKSGMTLGVMGTFESVGKYVAEPSSTHINIVSHGDAISGAMVLNQFTGASEYRPITSEFVVLNCDDGSANMRDVINPVFPPGVNGQIVHVLNIGEDYCQMQRGGPSQAPFNAKFRTINNADRACLKSSADGGGIMTFMYYFHNSVGGWQQMTSAPTTC